MPKRNKLEPLTIIIISSISLRIILSEVGVDTITTITIHAVDFVEDISGVDSLTTKIAITTIEALTTGEAITEDTILLSTEETNTLVEEVDIEEVEEEASKKIIMITNKICIALINTIISIISTNMSHHVKSTKVIQHISHSSNINPDNPELISLSLKFLTIPYQQAKKTEMIKGKQNHWTNSKLETKKIKRTNLSFQLSHKPNLKTKVKMRE